MNDKSSDGLGTVMIGICIAFAVFMFIVSSAAPVQAAEQTYTQPATSYVAG